MAGISKGKAVHPQPKNGKMKGNVYYILTVAAFISILSSSFIRKQYARSVFQAYTSDMNGDSLSSSIDDKATLILRAPALLALEREIAIYPDHGPCFNGSMLFPSENDTLCQELHCLWSEKTQQDIDIQRRPLTPLSRRSGLKLCPAPSGGQIKQSQQPVVSFIVTMHNNAEKTAQCILELFRTSREVQAAEVVVIDDGSTEDTAIVIKVLDLLQKYFNFGVKFHYNSQATGYGPANSKGIEMASGKYVALINNDVYVLKGWLSSLMWTIENRPNAGMVGPLFFNNGRRIEEAGGVILRGGMGINIGRGGRLSYVYSYARKADYISAACVIFSKEIFYKVGGFDMQYKYGYYEDTDLAFAVAKAGLDVIYQPLAVVYHKSGSTFGKDPDFKLKLMAENKKKFIAKWSEALKYLCYRPELGTWRSAHMRVLWVIDNFTGGNMSLMGEMVTTGFGLSVKPGHALDIKVSAKLRGLGVQVLPEYSSLAELTNSTETFGDYNIVIASDDLENGSIYSSLKSSIAQQLKNVTFIENESLKETMIAITSKEDWKSFEGSCVGVSG